MLHYAEKISAQLGYLKAGLRQKFCRHKKIRPNSAPNPSSLPLSPPPFPILPRHGVPPCPGGTTIQSKIHLVGECEIHKEERDTLDEEMRKLDVCDRRVW